MTKEIEKAEEPEAASPVSPPPAHRTVEDDDEAWEGFPLDTHVLRSIRGLHEG